MRVLTFGSNLAGHHGAGAALHAAQHHSAIEGRGLGPQGESYALPTKDASINTLPLGAIKRYVFAFISYAEQHPEHQFFVTAIGTGLAGYQHKDIAPMFAGAPGNCVLPQEWAQWLPHHPKHQEACCLLVGVES